MNSAALIVALCLTQAEGEAPAAPVAEPVAEPVAAPAADPEAAPDSAAIVPSLRDTPAAGTGNSRSAPNLEAVKRIMLKLPTLSPEEQAKAFAEVRALVGAVTSNPVLPPTEFDLSAYAQLADHDQVKVTARNFFEDVIAGNAGAVVAHAGFPFLLENRRYDRPDELRTEIARRLRSKRTDLLKLYDVEVMTPQEMELKYGKAPTRLTNWPLKQSKTYVAVGNLSGRAVVLLFRQVGMAWQAVGWHD